MITNSTSARNTRIHLKKEIDKIKNLEWAENTEWTEI